MKETDPLKYSGSRDNLSNDSEVLKSLAFLEIAYTACQLIISQ